MSNNRTAPAYQEYAANIIARLEYRTLTLPQRGLLYSMRLECWVNQCLPESPSVLARILGFDVAEVAAELPYIMPFFAVEDGRIYSPDLEVYRQHIERIRERQAQGGKVGAAKTNARKPAASVDSGGSSHPSSELASNPSSHPTGELSSNPRVARRVTSESFSFSLRPSLSPSQEGDVGVSTYEGGWGDFTADPEQEGE
jgi:hypothetical protein